MPSDEEEEYKNYETVSFIGQVQSKVKGVVQSGDWIVASGNNDGNAVAISSDAILPTHQIVGRAWESSDDTGIKMINVSVGLDNSAAYQFMFLNQQKQIDRLMKKVTAIEGMVYGERK